MPVTSESSARSGVWTGEMPAVSRFLQFGDTTGNRRDLQLLDLIGLDGKDLGLLLGGVANRLCGVHVVEIRGQAAEQDDEHAKRAQAPHPRLRDQL